jgi:hypothetical protein
MLFTHTLSDYQYQGARALIRSATDGRFLIPDWPLAINVGAVSSGSHVSVDYGSPYAELTDGDLALLWESVDKYEPVVIESADSADGFVLDSSAASYESAYLIPLREAIAPDGLDTDRAAGPVLQSSIEFILTDSTDQGQSSYPKYLGDDIIDDCPVIASATFSEPIQYEFDEVDPGVGYPSLFRSRTPSLEKFSMRWHVFTPADVYTLRRFVHSRRGKWKAFWLPSYRPDLQLAQSIGPSDTSLTVYAPAGVTDLGDDTFDVQIAGLYNKRITSYSVSGGTLILNFSGSLGVSLGTSAKVSYLRKVRFDADRIEFNHSANAGVICSVPCVEVP